MPNPETTTLLADQPADAAPGTATVSNQGPQVKVDVEGLITGKNLRCPIFDKSGLLLLAEGSLVTGRFKQLLLARGIRQVMLSQADAEAMSVVAQIAEHARGSDRLDVDLARRLDELIESGRLFIADSGSKFKERLVSYGNKGYNVEQCQKLVEQHVQTCGTLDAMIKSAAHGKIPGGSEIAAVIADYLTHLTFDSGCIHEIRFMTTRYAGLAQHCLQMSLLGMAIGIELEMSEEDIRNVGLAGLLHDLGMSRVPSEIVNNNRVLTQIEFVEIQKHPIHTLNLLRQVPGIPQLVPLICYQVHERPNGTGYPRRRQKKNIHLCARVLHVADAYLALTNFRPYRAALTPYAALECLLRQAQTGAVDSDVVRGLLQLVSLFPIGSLVELSDGRQARVLRRNGNNYSSPIVQIVAEADGVPVDALEEPEGLDPAKKNLAIVKVLPDDARQPAIPGSSKTISRA